MTKFKKFTGIFFLFLFCFTGYAQYELNPFKYVIVPKKYDFLKEENQYRVNSMTKYLFEEDGFIAFYQGDDYPADLNANPCLAVTAYVVNKSSLLTTKLHISLKDCRDKEAYRSAEGKSKIKEFDKTYVDALKKSFVSIRNLDYAFEESKVINAGSIAAVANETQKVNTASTNSELVTQKEMEPSNKPAPVKKNTPEASTTTVAAIPVVVATEPKVEEPKQEVIEEKEVVSEQIRVEESVQAVDEEKIIKSEEGVAVAATTQAETDKKDTFSGGARAFKNDTTTFLLIDQGNQMQAFVSESKNKNYKPGELIGTFRKTSLPNVFRVSWKKPQKDIDQTTAYFDDQGNLKIDILRNDKIEVLTFQEVK